MVKRGNQRKACVDSPGNLGTSMALEARDSGKRYRKKIGIENYVSDFRYSPKLNNIK